MNYTELADELFAKMAPLRKAKPPKHIAGALHGETFVLMFIAQRGAEVLPGEISQEMEVSSARIAAALNKLEGKGLITRRIDESDRRQILIGITCAGRALAEKHHRKVTESIARILSALGEHDARELIRIIGRLAEIAPEMIPEACE